MSEQTESRFELRRDGAGILLFTTGAFFAVLIGLALASSEPLEKAEGTAAIARGFAASIGLVPGLFLSAGCAVLGARLFLGAGADLPKSAGRLAIVAASLAVVLGAFSTTAGGRVGDWTAGTVARGTNVVLGALVGLAVLAVGVWVAWFRRAGSPVAPAAPAPRSAAPLAALADHGVSAEEAAALIPEDLPLRPAEARMDSPVTETPSLATPVVLEDVRRRGPIPEGARPLELTHAHATVTPEPVELPSTHDELAPLPVHHGAADPEGLLAPDGLDEDLALARPDLADEPLEELEPDVELGFEPEPEIAEVELIEADASTEIASVPRPSWEQSSLFEVEDEPAVDAYGTPLDEPAPEAEPAARDVILTPVPPQKRRKKVRAPELADERSRLLAEIGCLLLERGRVAVSMLQKQYDMDFEEATQVLDELQALGLIGPYLGGQRRDILLTRDEWLDKVSSL